MNEEQMFFKKIIRKCYFHTCGWVLNFFSYLFIDFTLKKYDEKNQNLIEYFYLLIITFCSIRALKDNDLEKFLISRTLKQLTILTITVM